MGIDGQLHEHNFVPTVSV